MAEGIFYRCDHCDASIEAWSDGEPYYLDASGAKQYAYHPDPEFERCVGNDSPHLCRACGFGTSVDSRAPIDACPSCGARDLVDTFLLKGERCPYCKAGAFYVDGGAIS